MITADDIKMVCNYSENTKQSPSKGIIYYLDSIIDNDEEIERKKREKVRVDREIKINDLLDIKSENVDHEVVLDWLDDQTPTMSVQVKSISLISKKFTGFENLLNEVIVSLDSIKSSPNIVPNLKIVNDNNISISENIEVNSRKVISKIRLLSGMIAMNSRSGPATSAIIGLDVCQYLYKYLSKTKSKGISIGEINGINIIPSNLINKNKIILVKTSTNILSGVSGNGLIVVNNIEKSTPPSYFITNTTNHDKFVGWFEIT